MKGRILWLLLLAGGAEACTICAGPTLDGLRLEHPQTLQISLATRAAIERGELDLPESTAPTGATGEEREALDVGLTPGWALMRALLAEAPAPTIGELLLVDRGTRRFIAGRGITHLDGRKPSYRIVTTAAALDAILKKRLTLSQAQESGLILIEPLRGEGALLIRGG